MLSKEPHGGEYVKNMTDLQEIRSGFGGSLKLSEKMHELIFLRMVKNDFGFGLLHCYIINVR